MRVAIVDYGSGNLRSAEKAVERAAREAEISSQIQVTNDPEDVRAADRIVLPGVGAYRDCRNGIRAIAGLWDAIDEQVVRKNRPFLGICVGMQLMASRGLEHGETEGFGWIAGDVVPIQPADPALKIPHMGWNTLESAGNHPLLSGISLGTTGNHAYFVHSFHFVPADPADLVATADYGGAIAAIVGRGNMIGTQFHPEKSQRLGLALIANFLRWNP